MSKPVIVIFGLVCYLVGVLAGVLGVCNENKPKEIAPYSDLERDIDKATCQAEKLKMLYSERIRLTCSPNPSPAPCEVPNAPIN